MKFKETNVHFYYMNVDEMNLSCRQNLVALLRTIKFHQICTESIDSITYQIFNFCQKPKIFTCCNLSRNDLNDEMLVRRNYNTSQLYTRQTVLF